MCEHRASALFEFVLNKHALVCRILYDKSYSPLDAEQNQISFTT